MTTAANPIAPGDLAVPHPHDAPFRNQVLEMLVAGAALGDILETLLHGLEQLRPGALCSRLPPWPALGWRMAPHWAAAAAARRCPAP